MRVYAGSVGGEAAIAQLRRYDMGRLVSPRGWRSPAPGVPWCLDKGAFGAFKRGEA